MSCKGCDYAVLLSGEWCCDYLSVTGHRRPCPPGEGCTVRKEGDLTKTGSAFMKRRRWDTEKAKALYDQKLSDAEIAGRVGTTASAVAFWRRGLGLPANQGQRPPSRSENPESKAASPPPVSPPLRTLALPADSPPRGAVDPFGRRQVGTFHQGPESQGGTGHLRTCRTGAGEHGPNSRAAEGGNERWLKRKRPGAVPGSVARSGRSTYAAPTVSGEPFVWRRAGTIRNGAGWRTKDHGERKKNRRLTPPAPENHPSFFASSDTFRT